MDFLWVIPKDMSLYCYALNLRISAQSSSLGVVCCYEVIVGLSCCCCRICAVQRADCLYQGLCSSLAVRSVYAVACRACNCFPFYAYTCVIGSDLGYHRCCYRCLYLYALCFRICAQSSCFGVVCCYEVIVGLSCCYRRICAASSADCLKLNLCSCCAVCTVYSIACCIFNLIP